MDKSESLTLNKQSDYPIKTASAKEVLQLLDSDEDAPDQLSSIVEQVARKAGISQAQLWKELEPWV